MLNFLKKVVSSSSPVTQSVAVPPTLTPVDPYMLGLCDTVLSGWFNQETDELFNGFPISAEDAMLDVGRDDGDSVHFCAMRGAYIIIADTGAGKIARAREHLIDTPTRELEYLVSDYDPLPLANITATRVVFAGTIGHVGDPQQFLIKLVRVGQPSAFYLFSVPHPALEDLQKDFATDEHFRKPNHVRVLDEKQFATLVCEVGLEIFSHSRYGLYWSLWMLLFWEVKVDFGNSDHPFLKYWIRTWQALLDSPYGPAIKQVLNAVVTKDQVVIVRGPVQAQSHRNSSTTAGRNSCRGHRTVPSNSRVVAPEQANGSGTS